MESLGNLAIIPHMCKLSPSIVQSQHGRQAQKRRACPGAHIPLLRPAFSEDPAAFGTPLHPCTTRANQKCTRQNEPSLVSRHFTVCHREGPHHAHHTVPWERALADTACSSSTASRHCPLLSPGCIAPSNPSLPEAPVSDLCTQILALCAPWTPPGQQHPKEPPVRVRYLTQHTPQA